MLLADDEDMGALTASTLDSSPPPGDLGSMAGASPTMDDMVLVDDAELQVASGASPAAAEQQAVSSPSKAPAAGTTADAPMADGEPAAAAAAEPASSAAAGASSALGNPFAAAASASQQQDSSDTSKPAGLAAAGVAGEAPAAAPEVAPANAHSGGDPPTATDPSPSTDGEELVTPAAAVDKAPGKLGADSNSGVTREGGKRQAMSHPVEVPPEECLS